MNDLTKRKVQLLILEIVSTYSNCRVHKFAIVGQPFQGGDLERKIGRELSVEERNLAVRAFDELVARDLLQSDFAVMVNPQEWVSLTDLGKRALQRQALDSLDEALQTISPKLVELRDGMWEGLASNRTNALQQAANSARELIDQTLKTNTPEGTRRERAKHIFKKKPVTYSESGFDAVDAEINCLLKGQNQLIAAAHARGDLDSEKIERMLARTEIILKDLLLS